MENFLEFGPLLGSPESITRPQGLVREIRAQLLQRYISRSQGSGTTGHQGAQDVVGAALLAVKELFDNSSQRPVVPILKQICSAATTANETPSRYVEAMIALWYSDASRQISRDASLEPEVPDANKYSNLGLLAMLLAVESWADPKDPALYEACLVSSAATSMIFAASLLSHHSEYAPWKAVASVVPVHHSVKAFLKCSWSVYRYGTHEPMRGPGYLSGALSQDAKLSVDGRRLLVPRNGTWARPDYWHPCKQTFGSPWNKFFKNSKKRIFTKKIPSSSPITYRMPSTAIKLAEMFEDYYFDLGERFDTVDQERLILSDDEIEQQHQDLANGTGLWYPDTIIDDEEAGDLYVAVQDYVNTMPWMAGPLSDSHGNATFTFLTSISRAFRFNMEPEAIDDDIWILLFGNDTAGEDTQQ